MNPTNYLRFVERENDSIAALIGKSKVKILQQWWNFKLDDERFRIHHASPSGITGEWRDVPMEKE